MVKAMKAMKAASGKAMTKSDTFAAIEKVSGVAKKDVKKVMDSLESVVTSAVKGSGKVVIPGVCRVVLKHKAATKTGKRMMFGKEVFAEPANPGDAPVRFERKDVWDMRWSDDNPELFALMEKTRMYIFRGLVAEEPVLSSAYLCGFSDLEIRAVLLDQLMREPEVPTADCMLTFETKDLRETNELLKAGKVQAKVLAQIGRAHV